MKKLQKQHFLAKMTVFFGDLWVHFESLIKWKNVHICHDQGMKKKKFTMNSQNITKKLASK